MVAVHAVLVGPNNSGKTTIIEALALLFGRDRLVSRLAEHDFHGSTPDEAARILCIATITSFTLPNDPHRHSSWFSPERGVEKWFDPNAKTLSATSGARHTDLAVQIGFAALFDLDELEAETIRFFVDDEATLGDPFAEDAHLRTIHSRVEVLSGSCVTYVDRSCSVAWWPGAETCPRRSSALNGRAFRRRPKARGSKTRRICPRSSARSMTSCTLSWSASLGFSCA